jgi:hypothetical protein
MQRVFVTEAPYPGNKKAGIAARFRFKMIR